MYCGNNALNPELVSGKISLGTRHKCLKKGIGKGMNMPYDPSYSQPYTPIDKTVVYCGDKNGLPPSYDRFGNLTECLQKGVGIGKKKHASKGLDSGVSNKTITPKNFLVYAFIYVLIWVILSVGVFCWLYFTKPVFVVNNLDNKKKINWDKFSMFFGIFTSIIAITLVVIWRVLMV